MQEDASLASVHLLSRNPIFTVSKNVWGYELEAVTHYSSDYSLGKTLPDSQDASAAVVTGDYVGLNTLLMRNKKALLTYSAEQLFQRIPYALPAPSSVIVIGHADQHDSSLIPLVEQFVQDGYVVALEWHPEVSQTSSLRNLAAMLCLARPAMVQDAQLQQKGVPNKNLIVRNVSTKEEFDILQQAGVEYFQGPFFKKPEIIPGRKLSAHQNSRFQILRIIESDVPDLDDLARAIQSDVTVSYRLLAHLNSPAFGLQRKIDSIKQAITLLGWVNVRNWLRAVLLVDLVQDDQQTELMFLSLTRAHFLEQLFTSYDYWDFRPEELFLVGMFSLLDAILGIAMPDVLSYLPLTDVQKKALLFDPTSEYFPFLSLVSALEDLGQHKEVDKMVLDLSLDPATIWQLYHTSSAWAVSILATRP